MSCFNEDPEFVSETIKSILDQTYKNFEFIIVLDDPENKVLDDFLKTYSQKDSRIRYIKHLNKKGLAGGRNTGIENSKGEYIAMMDATDIAYPERIEKQLKFIIDRRCDAVFGYMTYISEKDKVVGHFNPQVKNPITISQLLKKRPLSHPTAFFRAKVIKDNKYDESFMRGQDIDNWIKILKNGYKFYVLEEPLLKYRFEDRTDLESRLNKQIKTSKYGIKIICKHFYRLWYIPEFWRFAMVQIVYYALLRTIPKKILFKIMSSKKNYT